jgi:hypothetical protein
MVKARLTPAKIMQLGPPFWGSKTLLSAIELVFFNQTHETNQINQMTGFLRWRNFSVSC